MKRSAKWINLGVFLASVVAIAVVANIFAQRPDLRVRIDSTKTRAYSLSEQTMRMLRDIDGEWTIAMLLTSADVDRATLRQVDEVLARLTQASNRISVKRIDLGDPHSLADYESLLNRLRAIYADRTFEYEAHLDAGVKAIEELIIFAQQESGTLEQLVQYVEATQPDAQEAALRRVVQRGQGLALLAEQGKAVLEEVAKVRHVGEERPIPDYEIARSILAHALNTAANELHESAEAMGRWFENRELAAEIRQHGRGARREFEQRASQSALAAEPLVHLPPLELARIGRQLARGEAALILGPGRAAIIPSDQLVARSNIRQTGEGAVTFDQRFRGEQLIAAAMRSLLVEHMPLVVFVHAEEHSLMRPRERQVDLVGTATVLASSRFEMKEWIVGDMERPSSEPGQPVVYVVVPPPQRRGLEPSRRERELIATVDSLIAEGKPVLLSVYPSQLPRFGQPDPWAALAQPFGMIVDTGKVVHESTRTAADRVEVIKGQAMQQYERGHAIARAIHGQQAYFNLPMPIQIGGAAGVRHSIIAQVTPSRSRWLEPRWEVEGDRLDPPRSEQRFDEPIPLLVAAERTNPTRRGEQRFLLVSSGGWMLSYVSDAAVSIGGARMALMNPAHHELMLAGVAWLAGMDDLIAQSPTSQEVARLGEISRAAGVFWSIVFIGGIPLGCLALGLAVWIVRRR